MKTVMGIGDPFATDGFSDGNLGDFGADVGLGDFGADVGLGEIPAWAVPFGGGPAYVVQELERLTGTGGGSAAAASSGGGSAAAVRRAPSSGAVARASGGSAIPWILGVAALAAGTFYVLRKRRRARGGKGKR